ncbi:hypothetical protein MRB53_042176 [Persea americana]|nr:hypothetical protein MRB53_042176 [Persea americana]
MSRNRQSSPADATASKKRKATDDNNDSLKRARGQNGESTNEHAAKSLGGAPVLDDIDEDEWAAFERDVATPPPERSGIAVLAAPATIEAAAVLGTDGSDQAQHSGAEQRSKAQAEAEAEREEASRQLEEELDVMDALEERVKRLKERREVLRAGRDKQKHNADMPDEVTKATVRESLESGDGDEDDSDIDDFWK